ncbi:MAG: gliding motility-associated C-terminal domain-containing protein [Bacteroidia bacterium]
MIIEKHIKGSLLSCMLLFYLGSFAQVQNNPPMRQVISSAGGTSGTTLPWGTIDYTVGEPIIWTYSPAVTPLTIKVLTQGFQQPSTANSSLDANVIYSNASCIGGNNGNASLNLLSATGPVTYYWPSLNDSSASVANLAPGTYVFIINDGNFTLVDSVTIADGTANCADGLNFYTGITPNGDNNNDYWQIDSVSLIKENKVSIFNRWGDLVWNCENYDNTTDGKVWKGKSNQGQDLPDATYFYVVEANNRIYKGWIELTH